jgi:hypothetical protein
VKIRLTPTMCCIFRGKFEFALHTQCFPHLPPQTVSNRPNAFAFSLHHVCCPAAERSSTAHCTGRSSTTAHPILAWPRPQQRSPAPPEELKRGREERPHTAITTHPRRRRRMCWGTAMSSLQPCDSSSSATKSTSAGAEFELLRH